MSIFAYLFQHGCYRIWVELASYSTVEAVLGTIDSGRISPIIVQHLQRLRLRVYPSSVSAFRMNTLVEF